MTDFIQLYDDHGSQTVRMHVVVDGQMAADFSWPPVEARKVAYDILRWAKMPTRHADEDCEFCRSRR